MFPWYFQTLCQLSTWKSDLMIYSGKYNHASNNHLLHFCLYICFLSGSVDVPENFLGADHYGRLSDAWWPLHLWCSLSGIGRIVFISGADKGLWCNIRKLQWELATGLPYLQVRSKRVSQQLLKNIWGVERTAKILYSVWSMHQRWHEYRVLGPALWEKNGGC